ncbi:MAG: hypothetical protein KJO59_07160 [Ignavibacteria bacterium]|nr:hypothetical protein [Ignavibacteria bacterium]
MTNRIITSPFYTKNNIPKDGRFSLPNKAFKAPELLIPRRKPVGAVKINPGHVLAPKHFVFANSPETPIPPVDYAGNVLTTYTGSSITHIGGLLTDNDFLLVPRGTAENNGYGGFKMNTSISSADDITVLMDCHLELFTSDRSIVTFDDDAPWSWLDTSGGTLRVSAYNGAYDTDNAISSPGRYKLGLIWRADNSYQMIFQKKYTKSGTVTRRPFDGTVGMGNGNGDKAGINWGTSHTLANYGLFWWGVWNRSLSQAEVISVFDDPYQFLDPI